MWVWTWCPQPWWTEGITQMHTDTRRYTKESFFGNSWSIETPVAPIIVVGPTRRSEMGQKEVINLADDSNRLTSEISGAAFEVANVLRHGFLRTTDRNVGLLFNFGRPRLQYHRVVL